ncbi:MAG: hypothetical protein V7677_05730 [Motiliproteus sp.]
MLSIKPCHTPDGYIDHLELALSLWIISELLWENFENFVEQREIPYPCAVYTKDMHYSAQHQQ